MKYDVHVTDSDIYYGEKRSNSNCPIALAMKRAFPNDKVSVGRDVFCVDKICLPLPLTAINFIKDHDRGYNAREFVFSVNF